MGGSYTKAEQNAATIGDAFDYAEVLVTSVAYANTASSTATITHGLSGTPDFVLWSPSEDGSPSTSLTTRNSTSLVFTRTATTTSGTDTIFVLAGYAA